MFLHFVQNRAHPMMFHAKRRAEPRWQNPDSPAFFGVQPWSKEKMLDGGSGLSLEKIRTAAAKSPFAATFLVGSTEQGICELISGTTRWVGARLPVIG